MFPDEPKNKNLFNAHQDLANFFCKWLDHKWFRHCGIYVLYHTYLSGLFWGGEIIL